MQQCQNLNVQTLFTEKGFFETLNLKQKKIYKLLYKDGIVPKKTSLIIIYNNKFRIDNRSFYNINQK